MSRAKTLVTGATGMTGSHTVQLLLKRGHAVRVLAHSEDERSMRLQELGAEWVSVFTATASDEKTQRSEGLTWEA
jgi:NAD(P)H dehydrogenase (quinone)